MTVEEKIKEFREKFVDSEERGAYWLFRVNPDKSLSIARQKDVEAWLTEALTQEDYQEVLDLVDNAQSMGTLHSEEPPIDLIDRKELRKAMEKRGKV